MSQLLPRLPFAVLMLTASVLWCTCAGLQAQAPPTPVLASPADASVNTKVGQVLTWNPAATATQYHYQLDTVNSFSSGYLIEDTLAPTQVQLDTLRYGQTYFWRVRALNASGASPFATAFTFTNSSNGPVLVSPANLALQNQIGVVAEWNSHHFVQAYQIQVDTLNTFNSGALYQKTLAYQDTASNNSDTRDTLGDSLYYNQTHYWRVRSWNSVDTSDWTTFRQFTTGGVGPPLNLPNNGALNRDTLGLVLDWNAHFYVSGYQIQVDSFNLFNTPHLQDSTLAWQSTNSFAPDNQLTSDTLADNTPYFWRVRSFTEVDTSAWSGPFTFSTGPNPPFVPTTPAPTAPAAGATLEDTIATLDWDTVAGAASYEWQLDTSPQFNSGLLRSDIQLHQGGTNNGPDTDTLQTGLLVNTQYYWRVRARTPNAVSPWSAVQNFSTVCPSTPFNLTVDGPTSFCQGDSTLLRGPAGANSYTWTPASATADSLVVTQTNTYFLAINYIQGCPPWQSNGQLITVNSRPNATITPNPAPTTKPDTVELCRGQSATLIATGGMATYSWNNGFGSRTLSTDTAGAFQVQIENAAGCRDTSDTVWVQVYAPSQDTISVTGDTVFCAGDSVLLEAGPADQYLWTNGAVSQSIWAKTTDNYSVNVQVNGCPFNLDTVPVTANPLPNPSIQVAQGALTFCQGDSVLLTANRNYATINWSTSQTTDTIAVYNTQSISATVIDTNGCTAAAAPVNTTQNPKPSVSVGPFGPKSICSDDSLVLDAGPGFDSYAWDNGDTTQTVTVTTSDTLQVIVANTAGCTDTSDTAIVDVRPSPTATITPSGPVSICLGDTATLDAGPGFTDYLWSNARFTQTVEITQTGTYSVTVTNAVNCSTTSSPVTVIVNALPTASITQLTPVSICQGDTTKLAGPANLAAYTWLNTIGTPTTTQNGQQVNYTEDGVIDLVVEDANGCVDTTDFPVIVTVNDTPQPVITALGPTAVCQGDSVQLDAGPNYTTYNWSNGVNRRLNVLKQTDTLQVRVVNSDNCESVSPPFTVRVSDPQAVITPQGPTTFCDGSNVVLDSDPYDRYRWSTGDTTQSITVSTTQDVALVVEDDIACRDTSDTLRIIRSVPEASFSLTGRAFFLNDSTFEYCTGDTLNFSALGGFDTYLWSLLQTGAGPFTGQNFSLTTADAVRLFVGDSVGCSDDTLVYFEQNTSPTVDLGPDTFLCSVDSLLLDAEDTLLLTDYEWSTGSFSSRISINNSGTYSVEVQDTNRCLGRDTITVDFRSNPNASIIGPTSSLVGTIFELDINGTADSVFWDFGNGARPQTLDRAGPVRVEYLTSGEKTVTAIVTTNACTDTFTVTITIEEVVSRDALFAAEDLSLFPNPTTGRFQLELSLAQPEALVLELFDLNGRQLRRLELPPHQLHKAQMDISNTPSGVYLLKVSAGQTQAKARILKR